LLDGIIDNPQIVDANIHLRRRATLDEIGECHGRQEPDQSDHYHYLDQREPSLALVSMTHGAIAGLLAIFRLPLVGPGFALVIH